MTPNQANILKDKQVLVTGGAGFIGSNLCETLLKHNIKVVCLDNFSTGKRENIIDFLNNKNFKLIEGDITNIEDCNKACNQVEYVLHQAALGSVPRSINDPITTNNVNVSGFLNMLVAAKEANVERFVYAASSSTYGDHKALPKEEALPCSGKWRKCHAMAPPLRPLPPPRSLLPTCWPCRTTWKA